MERSAMLATSSTPSSSEISHEASGHATQSISQAREFLDKKMETKGVQPWLTTQVWMIMRKENPEFFRAYDARLECIEQIKLFNFFIEQQHRMINRMMAISAPQPAVPNSSDENMIHHMAVNPVEIYMADEWRNEVSQQQPVPLQVQYSEQMQNLQDSEQLQNLQDSEQMQNFQLSGQMHNPQYSGQMQDPQDYGQLQNLQYSKQIQNIQYSGQMQNLQDYGQLQNLQFSEQMQNLQ